MNTPPETCPARRVRDPMPNETCCVVDQFCIASPGVENPTPARYFCFSCGLAVCGTCSTKRTYHEYGVVRLCNDCQIEYDGNDKRVMARLRRMAGY